MLNVRFLVRPTARPTAELGRQEPLAKSAPRRQTGRRCLASSANAGCRITDKRQIRTFAPRSPDHSSSRIASGCSMRGTNGDHRQPIRRQRSGAWSDRQPLQHPWRQIGQPQEWADEGLGDARGDRSAPDRCDIPAIQPPPPVPDARDDTQQVWVWRRSVGRLIDLRRLSLGRPNVTAL